MLLVLHEKHGRRYFIYHYHSEPTFETLALYIVRERSEEGYWYTELSRSEQPVLARALKGDKHAAVQFLSRRQEYEYEGYTLENLEHLEAPT
jgi:hypothetical protein